MKLKLNKHSVTMLSSHIEKMLDEAGCKLTIDSKDITYWIAMWGREQMENEAQQIFADIVARD